MRKNMHFSYFQFYRYNQSNIDGIIKKSINQSLKFFTFKMHFNGFVFKSANFDCKKKKKRN